MMQSLIATYIEFSYIDLVDTATQFWIYLFEACSASIAAESHRTNWNLESDNERKGE